MIQNKIKNIKDTLHSFPEGTTMGLEYLVDLGKESQKTMEHCQTCRHPMCIKATFGDRKPTIEGK
mgnify:CR=1 FL=1